MRNKKIVSFFSDLLFFTLASLIIFLVVFGTHTKTQNNSPTEAKEKVLVTKTLSLSFMFKEDSKKSE